MITEMIGRMLGWEADPDQSPSEHDPPLRRTDSWPTHIDDADELAREVGRARREGHDLAIVVLSASPSNGAELREPMPWTSRVSRMMALLEAVAIREVLRRDDVVFYQASEDRFLFSIAESDEDAVDKTVERVRLHLAAQLAVPVRAGVAHLTADGSTLDELIAVAAQRTPRSRSVSRGSAGVGHGTRSVRSGLGRSGGSLFRGGRA